MAMFVVDKYTHNHMCLHSLHRLWPARRVKGPCGPLLYCPIDFPSKICQPDQPDRDNGSRNQCYYPHESIPHCLFTVYYLFIDWYDFIYHSLLHRNDHLLLVGWLIVPWHSVWRSCCHMAHRHNKIGDLLVSIGTQVTYCVKSSWQTR